MPTTPANGLTLAWDRFGDRGPTVFLIMGIGAQRIFWPAPLCEALAARGLQVIRFDNRDVGESTRLDHLGVPRVGPLTAKALLGVRISAPYTLDDMAEDTLALATALGAPRAHFVGASMGGMIAQHLALRHPTAVRSLTSIMSTTGDRRFLSRDPRALAALLAPRPTSRAAAIDGLVDMLRVLHGDALPFDTAAVRALAAEAFDRGPSPAGFGRQWLAILASGNRTRRLAQVRAPTLVLHGDRDPLIPIAAGEATARAIPGARFVPLRGMGHTLPVEKHAEIVDAIAAHVHAAEGANPA